MTQKKSNGMATLLDTLKGMLNEKTDAALARRLEIAPPVVSRLRSGKLPLGPIVLLSMHEESGLSFGDLRALAAA